MASGWTRWRCLAHLTCPYFTLIPETDSVSHQGEPQKKQRRPEWDGQSVATQASMKSIYTKAKAVQAELTDDSPSVLVGGKRCGAVYVVSFGDIDQGQHWLR